MPFLRNAVGVAGRNAWEIIAVRVIAAVVNDVRFLLGLPVQINYSILEVNAIPGHSNNALHHVKSRFGGGEEHHDIAAFDVAIWNQGHPPGSWRDGVTIDEHMIADKKRVLH